jgi:large subunit ribosomal protein L6
MRKKYTLEMEVPEGITCEFVDGTLKCKKGEKEISKEISILGTNLKVEGNKLRIVCEKANKKNIAVIKANEGHIKNMFAGVEEDFVYELEVCNVHFPMTVKAEGEKITISNFLGEKIDRIAKIISGVKVEIKGSNITVSGSDIEKTGQTAANIEKAAKVPNKDRRIFQDGIFMTSKPGGAI